MSKNLLSLSANFDDEISTIREKMQNLCYVRDFGVSLPAPTVKTLSKSAAMAICL